MQQSRKKISLFHYYILLSTLTNLVFLLGSAAITALFPVGLSGSSLLIIFLVLAWKGGLVALMVWFLSKKGGQRSDLVKFIGTYLGRFYGFIFGALLGVEVSSVLGIAAFVGVIVGALAFYFLGWWVGSKTVLFLSQQLEKVFVLPETPTPEQVEKRKPSRRGQIAGMVILGLIYPLMLVDVGSLFIKYEFFEVLLPEYLPVIRGGAVLYSIISIGFPWFFRDRFYEGSASKNLPSEQMLFWVGLIFSMIPAVYGLVLFLTASRSLIEFSIFSVVASLAVFVWGFTHLDQS